MLAIGLPVETGFGTGFPTLRNGFKILATMLGRGLTMLAITVERGLTTPPTTLGNGLTILATTLGRGLTMLSTALGRGSTTPATTLGKDLTMLSIALGRGLTMLATALGRGLAVHAVLLPPTAPRMLLAVLSMSGMTLFATLTTALGMLPSTLPIGFADGAGNVPPMLKLTSMGSTTALGMMPPITLAIGFPLGIERGLPPGVGTVSETMLRTGFPMPSTTLATLLSRLPMTLATEFPVGVGRLFFEDPGREWRE